MKTLTELAIEQGACIDDWEDGSPIVLNFYGGEAQLLATFNAWSAQQATPKLTKEQAIVITGFTGVMAVNSFSDFHADVEKRLGRPVWTHQFPELVDEIKAAYKDDFLAMVSEDKPL